MAVIFYSRNNRNSSPDKRTIDQTRELLIKQLERLAAPAGPMSRAVKNSEKKKHLRTILLVSRWFCSTNIFEYIQTDLLMKKYFKIFFSSGVQVVSKSLMSRAWIRVRNRQTVSKIEINSWEVRA